MNNFQRKILYGKSLFTPGEKKQLFEECMSILGLHRTKTVQAERDDNPELRERLMKEEDVIVPRGAFLSLPIGIVFADRDGQIVTYNQEASRLLDSNGYALKGKNVREFCAHQEEVERITQELQEHERNGGRGYVENTDLEVRDCHGKIVAVKASFYFHYDEQHQRKGLLIQFLKDIFSQQRHLRQIIYEGSDLLGIKDSILWLVDDLTQSIDTHDAHVEIWQGGVEPAYVTEKLKLKPEVARLFLDKQYPLFITNIQGRRWRDLYVHYDWAKRHDWKSLLSVPIIINDRVVGIWNLHCRDIRHFDRRELELADIFGRCIATELFKPDLSNQSSLYYHIRTLYSHLKQMREKLVEKSKQLDTAHKRIAAAWHDGRESAERISSPFEWINGALFTSAVKLLNDSRDILEARLMRLRKKASAEVVSLFFTDPDKPFLLKKIAEADLNIETGEVKCRFRKSIPNDKDGFNVDEIYNFFPSICGQKLHNIDAKLLTNLNQKIEDVQLTKEVKTWLQHEGFTTLGDLALMREEDFKNFDILTDTREYIKDLLARYNLGFGMQFFLIDDQTVIRIERDIANSGLFPPGNLERITRIPSSEKLEHYLSVPICYNDSKKSRNRMVGFIRLLNKTFRRKGHRCHQISGGFTEDDVDSVVKMAKEIGHHISDFYAPGRKRGNMEDAIFQTEHLRDLISELDNMPKNEFEASHSAEPSAFHSNKTMK